MSWMLSMQPKQEEGSEPPSPSHEHRSRSSGRFASQPPDKFASATPVRRESQACYPAPVDYMHGNRASCRMGGRHGAPAAHHSTFVENRRRPAFRFVKKQGPALPALPALHI